MNWKNDKALIISYSFIVRQYANFITILNVKLDDIQMPKNCQATLTRKGIRGFKDSKKNKHFTSWQYTYKHIVKLWICKRNYRGDFSLN